MQRTIALGFLVFALSGCGTVENFREDANGRAKPYGGVEIAVNRFRHGDDVQRVTMFPFWSADLALTAIGDTCTLPVTIPLGLIYQAQDNSSRQPQQAGSVNPSQQTQPPAGDPRPDSHLTRERITGVIE